MPRAIRDPLLGTVTGFGHHQCGETGTGDSGGNDVVVPVDEYQTRYLANTLFTIGLATLMHARYERMNSFTIVSLELTTVILLVLAAVAWFHHEKRGARVFVVLQVVSAVWAGLTVLGLTTPPGALRMRIFGLTSGLSLLVIVFWAAFILSYTGRKYWLSPMGLGVASLPLVICAGLYFTVPTWRPLVGAVSQSTLPIGTVVSTSIGPLGTLIGVYVYLVFLVGLGLVVKTVLEGSRLFLGQALAFIFGSLITIVASLLVVLDIGWGAYPLTQMALGPQSALWGYAIFGQQFLGIVPAVEKIGQQAIFDDLKDGILVVDDDGIVVRTNPRIKEYLGAYEPTGEPITAILAEMNIDALADLPARFEFRNRTLRAESSVIRDWQGEEIGQAVVVSDISQLATREQRLAVLNRVLRHNVRNDMNIVLAIGQQLQTQRTDELTKHGKTLTRTAHELNRVSEKALEANQMFERSVANDTAALREIITDIVSRLGKDYPDATIHTSIAVDSVYTDAQILGKVLEEIVANALEHAGESPAVQIAVRSRDRDVAVTVTDDGPGIPQSEIQPLRDGEETSLEHTSSFGLWFSKWGMQKIGGDLDITATHTGTEVTLAVPHSGDGAGETRGGTRDDDALLETDRVG